MSINSNISWLHSNLFLTQIMQWNWLFYILIGRSDINLLDVSSIKHANSRHTFSKQTQHFQIQNQTQRAGVHYRIQTQNHAFVLCLCQRFPSWYSIISHITCQDTVADSHQLPLEPVKFKAIQTPAIVPPGGQLGWVHAYPQDCGCQTEQKGRATHWIKG